MKLDSKNADHRRSPHEHGRTGRRGPDWALNDRRPRTTSGTDRNEIRAWFIGNLADGWFVGEPEITVDDYEILVIGTLASLDTNDLNGSERETAYSARIERHRNDTRERRMVIASEAQDRFGRKVSWGARIDDATMLFTTASVPVMTRLRMDQRRTLDTLVEANVARSKSDALAWCVDLVSQHENDWIASLRAALDAVTAAREGGPSSGDSSI